MQVKRFEGNDIHEVLRLIKYEMGPNAVILSTRHIKRGNGVFGMFGRPAVEVTAAIDREVTRQASPVQPQEKPQPAITQTARNGWDSAQISQALDPLHQDMDQIKEIVQQLALKERHSPPLNYAGLTRELNVVKLMLEHLVKSQHEPQSPLFEGPMMPYYQRLLASGLEKELARRLIEKAQNSITDENLTKERYVRGYVANSLMKSILVTGPLSLPPDNQAIIAFVGPTGVGKTTTIAKLAAHFALTEKKKIALITLDTYRIAAIEQLRIFAKIINLPIDIVLNKTEFDQTLDRHRDKDLILIDTAGRSQRDALQMADLQSLFPRPSDIDIRLVLSATSALSNLYETVERFRPLQPTSLVFTKLDESSTYGMILGTVLHEQIPISYFTTGQRVPEDIEVATPERLVDLILNLSQWYSDDEKWKEGKIA
jgi:flagellar biosynthesis protein FlhF